MPYNALEMAYANCRAIKDAIYMRPYKYTYINRLNKSYKLISWLIAHFSANR